MPYIKDRPLRDVTVFISPPPLLPLSPPPRSHCFLFPLSIMDSLIHTVHSTNTLPQRRHRKMLKDGSSEVWPQEAEDIFLDGLRDYWNSPWANTNRGRSRWRNQYLVDYLKKYGIDRSKKQVASHIQVLRNMWKGHPGQSRSIQLFSASPLPTALL